MATWAIGDVHGCHQTLQALVGRLALVPGRDRLWLVGDVVNRGSGSLATLAWLHQMRAHLTLVLGNHDLQLLMAWRGVKSLRSGNSLGDILRHPQRDTWLTWLAGRPLLHLAPAHAMVHAGLRPEWTFAAAQAASDAVSAALTGPQQRPLLAALDALATRRRAGQPATQRGGLSGLSGLDALADDAASMTEMRMLGADGQPLWAYRGEVRGAPPGARPWFQAAGRRQIGRTVVFGHWAALGIWQDDGVLGLDSGCVWGRQLTAWRLEDGHHLSEGCHPEDGPMPKP